MATTLSFKKILDVPLWRIQSPVPAASAAGTCVAYDMRSGPSNHCFVYALTSSTVLYQYNPILDDWQQLGSPALAGTFGAGTAMIFHPSQGPSGTLAAGWSTTAGALTTALPAAVGINQLANRGDGTGYRIRITGSSAGGSGRTCTRTIIGNSAGTTPTITLDSALDFTPASGDAYEILSGRVYMLNAGTVAAGSWKYYDIATNSFSGNLTVTNLPASIATDSSLLALAESYTPWNRTSGEGFVSGGGTYDTNPSAGWGIKNCIVASAANSTTITAASASTPSLFTNEYVNFQVRIVEDTSTPTAVGQAARITAHTSGTTPVFTVTWPVTTPSATAKFVIENDNDKILYRGPSTTLYTYNINANTWSTTATFATGGTAAGAGVFMEQCFGMARDPNGYKRHSHILVFRGAATNTLELFDIAAGATGTWTTPVVYGGQFPTFTTGTTWAYDPVTNEGQYVYCCLNGTQRFFRFNMKTQTMEPGPYLRVIPSTAVVGQKLAVSYFMDGNTKIAFCYNWLGTSTNFASFMVPNY